MMYSIGVCLYALMIRLVAPFNKKAALLIKGQKEVFAKLKNELDPHSRYIWVHAASLGEFEQGRPILEKIKTTHPEYKIVLTFFSPSGYEVRKNYSGADVICYLPFDLPWNARQFIELVNPSMVLFIKYEFWLNYLHLLKKREIPLYSISSIFRKEQLFFKWYGFWYRRVLSAFTHFFVQDEASKQLLKQIGILNTTVVGDTRFDRVVEIKNQAKELPIVQSFIQNRFTIVAGSSWQPDEELLIHFLHQHPESKLILAPHLIHESRIKEIIGKINLPVVRYSEATLESVIDASCLIIDNFGMLSSIYRYGAVGYIGGGFGSGIHNTLEAAVYGIPVLFGPNYQRFMEAKNLVEQEAAFCVTNQSDFDLCVNRLMNDSAFLQQCGINADQYVLQNRGAVDKILKKIKLQLFDN